MMASLKWVERVWGVMGGRGNWGGKTPYMGPYLPIKIVHAPCILCGMI